MSIQEEKNQIREAINNGTSLSGHLKEKLLTVLDDGSCIYNGTSYGPGSFTCQNGQQMVCDGGGSGNWFVTGSGC